MSFFFLIKYIALLVHPCSKHDLKENIQINYLLECYFAIILTLF